MKLALGVVACAYTIVLFNGIFYFVYKINGTNYTTWMDYFFEIYMITTPIVFGYVLFLIHCVFWKGFDIKSFHHFLLYMFKHDKVWFLGFLLTIEYVFMVIYPLSKYMQIEFGTNTSFDDLATLWSYEWMMTLCLALFFMYLFSMINVVTYCFDPKTHNYCTYTNKLYLCLFIQFPFKCFSLCMMCFGTYQLICFFDWGVSDSIHSALLSTYGCTKFHDYHFVGFANDTTMHKIMIWIYATLEIVSVIFTICLQKRYSRMFNYSANDILCISSIETSIILYSNQLQYNQRLSLNNAQNQLDYNKTHKDRHHNCNCCKASIFSSMHDNYNAIKSRSGIPLAYIIVALNGLITSIGALYQYFVFDNNVNKMEKEGDNGDSLQLYKQQKQYCMFVFCISILIIIIVVYSVLLTKIKKIKTRYSVDNNDNNNIYSNNDNKSNIELMLSDSSNRRLILSMKFVLLIIKPYLIVVANDESRALVFEVLQCMTLIVVSYLTFSRLYLNLNFHDESYPTSHSPNDQTKHVNAQVYDTGSPRAELCRNNTCTDDKDRLGLTLDRNHSMSSIIDSPSKTTDDYDDIATENDDIVNTCQNVTIKKGYSRIFAVSYMLSYFISTLCFYFCFVVVVVKKNEIWQQDGRFQWFGNILAFGQYFWLFFAKMYHNEIVIFDKTKHQLDLINENNFDDWFANDENHTITKAMLYKYEIYAQTKLDNVVFWLILLTLYALAVCGWWIYSYLVIIKDKIGYDMAFVYLIQLTFSSLIALNSFGALCCFQYRKPHSHS